MIKRIHSLILAGSIIFSCGFSQAGQDPFLVEFIFSKNENLEVFIESSLDEDSLVEYFGSDGVEVWLTRKDGTTLHVAPNRMIKSPSFMLIRKVEETGKTIRSVVKFRVPLNGKKQKSEFVSGRVILRYIPISELRGGIETGNEFMKLPKRWVSDYVKVGRS